MSNQGRPVAGRARQIPVPRVTIASLDQRLSAVLESNTVAILELQLQLSRIVSTLDRLNSYPQQEPSRIHSLELENSRQNNEIYGLQATLTTVEAAFTRSIEQLTQIQQTIERREQQLEFDSGRLTVLEDQMRRVLQLVSVSQEELSLPGARIQRHSNDAVLRHAHTQDVPRVQLALETGEGLFNTPSYSETGTAIRERRFRRILVHPDAFISAILHPHLQQGNLSTDAPENIIFVGADFDRARQLFDVCIAHHTFESIMHGAEIPTHVFMSTYTESETTDAWEAPSSTILVWRTHAEQQLEAH